MSDKLAAPLPPWPSPNRECWWYYSNPPGIYLVLRPGGQPSSAPASERSGLARHVSEIYLARGFRGTNSITHPRGSHAASNRGF